jgi:hypothetical protein
LRIITDVGSLHAKQAVQIHLVRREDHVEFWVLEIEPRDVALVVVVREQRIRAKPQEIRESRIVAQRCRFTQVRRHRLHEFGEGHMIGNRLEQRALASHHRVGAVKRRFLVRMRGHVGVELVRRHAPRKESAPRRHRRGVDKRLVVVDQIEASAVDFQIFTERHVLRIGLARE